jgi:hypothetical protein
MLDEMAAALEAMRAEIRELRQSLKDVETGTCVAAVEWVG